MGGEDANRAFNECVVVEFTGSLDRNAFEAAYHQLVQSHDVLRTTLSADGNWGQVWKLGSGRLTYVDVSSLSPDSRSGALHALRVGEVTTAFELEKGPLHRATLVTLREGEHHFFFSAHHVICDWWTTGVLMRNLGLLYRQHLRGETIALDVQSYAEYALEQKRREDSEEAQAELAFWRETLAGYLQNWSLPSDYTRPLERTYTSRRLDVEWSDDASATLRALAKRHNCTLTVAFLALLQLWLYLKAQAEDVVIGLPSAGQALSAGAGLAGHCTHLLPVRLLCTPDATAASLLTQCKTTMLHLLEHRGVTYSRLLEHAEFRRKGHPPLVQITANIDMGLPALNFASLQVKYATIPRQYDAFELAVNVVAWSSRITVQAQFNTSLFSEATVREWVDEWTKVTKIAFEYPDIELARLRQ
jgi:hypothetical protein